MQQQLEQIIESLREKGLRITPQRVAVMNYLLNTEEHPNVEKIYKKIRQGYPMISLSTVYKTLDMLKEKGIVNGIQVQGEIRYDAHIDEHVNLICMSCGRIEDIDEDLIKDVQKRAASKSGYRILKSDFELFGYCDGCKSKCS